MQLLVPLLLTAVFATLLLAVISERTATRQSDDLMRHRADSVLARLDDRLTERLRSKEVFADLLAGNADLASALTERDVASAAQVLVPRRTRLDLGLVQAFTSDAEPLLVLGGDLGFDVTPMVAGALSGVAGSRVVVGRRGLLVVAIAPVKAADGIVGAVLVGRVLGGLALTDIAGDQGVSLAVTRQGQVVATSFVESLPRLQSAVAGLGSGAVAAVGGEAQFVVRAPAEGGELLAMVPVQDVKNATAARRRGTAVITVSLLLGLTGIGLLRARRITGSLRNTVSLAQRMADGEYDRRVPASGTRELDELSRAVNHLAEQIETRVSELQHRAGHDALTGLANRVQFVAQVTRAIPKGGRLTGVLFVDLDDFKRVNDSLGHAAGDRLVVTAGLRLQQQLRRQDTVARLGGDEFAVLVQQVDGMEELTVLAERLLTALRQPVELDGRLLVTSASIGIAFTGDNQIKADDMLRDADAAMYLAKRSGKDRYALFEPGMHAELLARVELQADLARAVEAGQMAVHYQPVVDLRTGRTQAVEALLRWHHPQHGAISPVRFIPLAEDSGVIVELGAWVLRTACTQLRAWQCQDLDGPPLRLNVNVSVRQLHAPGFLDQVVETLRVTNVSPEDLTLEITESVFVGGGPAHALLDKVHALGIHIAIDDFGTGYSSLSYLQDLPVDCIKIDRAFVQRLRRVGNNGLVESIMALAHALGAEVVAEGIETSEQLDLLMALGCRLGQGFLLAHPAHADALDLGRTVVNVHGGYTQQTVDALPVA